MFNLIELLAELFVLIVGIGVLVVAVLYVIDRTQTKQAVRRNFPVIGRFRYLFENLGEFFRQYFFAMDREEMPFNRAERSWVYRAAKDEDTMVAFGSTRDMRPRRDRDLRQLPVPDAGSRRGRHHRHHHRPVLQKPLHDLVGLPHLRHELRGDLEASRHRAVQRRPHGGDLDEHRRRRPVADARRRRRRHRVPDGHGQVRCP